MHFFKLYLSVVVLTILTATASKVYAAFPIQPQTTTTTTTTKTVASQTDVDFKALVNGAIERFTQRSAPARIASDSEESAGFGIASFGLGLGSLLALVGGFVYGLLGLFVFSALAGVAAIILGYKGIDRPKKGLAVAGLIMGTLNSAILAFAVFLAFLAILIYIVTLGYVDVI